MWIGPNRFSEENPFRGTLRGCNLGYLVRFSQIEITKHKATEKWRAQQLQIKGLGEWTHRD